MLNTSQLAADVHGQHYLIADNLQKTFDLFRNEHATVHTKLKCKNVLIFTNEKCIN